MDSPYLHETAFDPTLKLLQASCITRPQETIFSFCLGLVSLKITKKEDFILGCRMFVPKSMKRFKNPQHKEVVKMNEDIVAFGRALEEFLKIFRKDVMEVVDQGALPISYVIAFREPTLDGFETIQYIARSTQGCPPGLEKALKEVVYKWAAKAFTEFTTVDDRPVFKQ